MGGGSLSLTKAGSRKSEARSLVSHIVRRRMSTSGLDEEVGKVGDEVRWVSGHSHAISSACELIAAAIMSLRIAFCRKVERFIFDRSYDSASK